MRFQPTNRHYTPAKPDRDYYRKLSKISREFKADLERKQWCDLWHTHFDWHGVGNLSYAHRIRHLNALLRALERARKELSNCGQAVQLFAIFYPHSSGDNAVYLHTPNPNGTEFPCVYHHATPVDTLPPMLSGRVNLAWYSVFKLSHGKHWCYAIQAKFD